MVRHKCRIPRRGEIERKRSAVDRGKSGDEKGRTDRAATRRETRRERRSRDEKQSADHMGDGSRSVARAGNRSLCDGSQCDESGETDSQSQELRLRGRRLILHSHPPSRRGPPRCRFCCCRSCLDGGMIGWTGCHHPLPFSFLHSHLCCHAGSTCPLCNEHLPRSGGREITRSFIPYLHSCQLMSHRVQRCAATFSVSFLSSACSLPLSYTILRLPGWIDRWHELSR